MHDLLRGTLAGVIFGFWFGAMFVMLAMTDAGWLQIGLSSLGVVAVGVAHYYWQKNHPRQVA